MYKRYYYYYGGAVEPCKNHQHHSKIQLEAEQNTQRSWKHIYRRRSVYTYSEISLSLRFYLLLLASSASALTS